VTSLADLIPLRRQPRGVISFRLQQELTYESGSPYVDAFVCQYRTKARRDGTRRALLRVMIRLGEKRVNYAVCAVRKKPHITALARRDAEWCAVREWQ